MKTGRTVLLALITGLATWVGCSANSTQGVTVSVVLQAPASPDLVGEVRMFGTDLGFQVVVNRGYLSTGTVEIGGCGAAGPSSWRHLLIREAHAHSVGSPTILGIPAVESLLAKTEMREVIGVLHPPEGSYCRVKQTIRAADADALGMPPDGSVVGKSLLVEGTFARSGEAARPFAISSTASFDVETTLPEASLAASRRRSAQVVLSKVGDRWFDAIDFASGDTTEMARRVLDNVRKSLGAHIE